MDGEEIKEKKLKLEEDVADLLQKFEQQTGTIVADSKSGRQYAFDNKPALIKFYVKVEIQ